jgi:hypothetical protein
MSLDWISVVCLSNLLLSKILSWMCMWNIGEMQLGRRNKTVPRKSSATQLMTLITLPPNDYYFKLWYLGVELGSSTVLVCSTLSRGCLNSILVAVVHTSDSFGWIFWWQRPLRDNWCATAISLLFVGRIHCIGFSYEVGEVILTLLNKNKQCKHDDRDLLRYEAVNLT